MKQKLLTLSLATATVAVVLPTVVLADPMAAFQRDHEQAREALRRGEILPLTRILPIVQKRVPGEVIKIKLDDDDDDHPDRIIYEVKVLTSSGRVIELELDARTGKVLEVEED